MMEDCEICFLKYQYTNMTGLQCGHRFCKSCWVEYLTTKIMEEGLCKSIACAAHGCGELDIFSSENLADALNQNFVAQQLL